MLPSKAARSFVGFDILFDAPPDASDDDGSVGGGGTALPGTASPCGISTEPLMGKEKQNNTVDFAAVYARFILRNSGRNRLREYSKNSLTISLRNWTKIRVAIYDNHISQTVLKHLR